MKETYDKNKFTLMIVEDNLQLLEFMQKTLIESYNVYYAKNGEEALEKLKFIPKPDTI